MNALATEATATGALLKALAVTEKLAQNAAAPKKGCLPTLGDNYVIEPKFDGWRILAYVHEDGVTMFTRTGNTYNGKLPMVEAELAAAFPAGTWIDGEACAYSEEAGGQITDKWHTVQSVLTTHKALAIAEKVSYMVFDLIAHRDIDARAATYATRRKLLETIFHGENHYAFDKVKLTPNMPATPESHAENVKRGFEGSVVKRIDARYASDVRGGGWEKWKPVATIDAVVMGFQQGKNGFTGMVGAVIFGQYDENGVLVERGKCSGMDMKTRLSMTNTDWMGRVIEVAHEGVSIGENESGRFRFPRFKRVRKDKKPTDCTFHDA